MIILPNCYNSRYEWKTDMGNNNMMQNYPMNTAPGQMPFTYSDMTPMPAGQSTMPMAGTMPTQSTMPVPTTFPTQGTMVRPGQAPSSMFSPESDMPETLTNPIFTAGYLSTQIGKLMRVEFLIGNNMTDRVGTLLAVGSSYIVLQSIDPSSIIMCDLFSIKFATIVVNPGASHAGSLFPMITG